MLPDADASDRPLSRPWWQRLHASLMPDYNAKAAAYWWSAVLLGAAVLAGSVLMVMREPVWTVLQVLGGMAVAMLAGCFPVRIPRQKHSFAAGEIFIFLLLLIHGPAAAALAAAAEAAVGSWRTSKRWTSRLASPAMAGLAMFAAGSLLHVATAQVGAAPGQLILVTMVCALTYFAFNTLLVTTVLRLKRNQSFSLGDLVDVFGWVGTACAGCAAVSALLYLTFLQSGMGVLAAMLPLLAMMLATLHYYFRQQEIAEATREAISQANAEASEREHEAARRHVAELQASERRFHSAFTHASIGMALLSFEGRILQANPALRALLGCSGEELVHQPVQDHVWAEDAGTLQAQLDHVNRPDFEGFALEMRCRHSGGDVVWVAAHCSFFSEPGTTAPCLILQVQDITARRKAEDDLHHIAYHDSLTGLPNRRRFHELLAQAVEQIKGRGTADAVDAFAVMFLDFDRFKVINDSLGHSAGDEFLIQVSRRIQNSLRPNDIVARLGGDEFGVLVSPLDDERSAVALAERLMDGLRQPFLVAGTELNTSASIGITFSAPGYTSSEDMLRDADTAMYKAKAAGKARYALFDVSLHTEVARRLRLEGELRRAIDEGMLSVAYQPIWDLGSPKDHAGAGACRLSGFEALVRWPHPQDGSLSPSQFLPIAEEAGLMPRLTDFVLRSACHQLREWQQLAPAYGGLMMNVNISGHDLAHAALVTRVARALDESGLQPQHLCLELTENILMSRLEGALPVLSALRRLGVLLAIDDFGTGYSSLSHLSTLPIDSLKIDRSFVARLHSCHNESAVVRSIVLLGHALGKVVVAEGIETPTQLEALREMGCRRGQGFLLARPMSAADLSLALHNDGLSIPSTWPAATTTTVPLAGCARLD